MRRLTLTIGLLQLYALGLTLLQMPGGVRTDEAKYLLSIPYPHPPLLRSLLASFAALPGHEFIVRFVIASAVVQAVWLLWDLGYILTRPGRVTLCLCWLTTSAVVLQSGTIMLIAPTALFGLVCTVLTLRPRPLQRTIAPLLGCFWLLGLFSAYQTALYLPMLVSILLSCHVPWRRITLYLGIPLVLLTIYTLGHPLILASMMNVTGQDIPLPLALRAGNILMICLLAGSGMTTIAGGLGILTSGRADLILTLLLLLTYIALTSQSYYAILLTPLLIAGVFLLLKRRRLPALLYLPAHILLSILLVMMAMPPLQQTTARAAMRFLAGREIRGLVLIDGPFGHEWQYESAGQIGRYSQDVSSSVESQAQAIVCTKRSTCEDDVSSDVWVRMTGAPVEVWIRRIGRQ